MRIILLETEHRHFPGVPLALTPLLGKPLLERVIEYWVARGATSFDIFCEQSPLQVENKVGHGRKWGIPVRYHLTKLTTHLSNGDRQENLVVGNLCDFPPPEGLADEPCITLSSVGEWSGWIYASATDALLFHQSQTVSGSTRVVVHPSRSIGSKEAFLALQLFVLRQGCVEARQVQPDVWIAPGAVIHPTTKLMAPVYIGKNSVIGPHNSLGPAVVVDRNSQLAGDSVLVDSWVSPGTFVPRGRKANNEIVGNLGRPAARWPCRLLALLLLALTWPLLLLSRLRKETLSISPHESSDVYTSPLPAALAEVVRGRLALVGRRPRTMQEMQELPLDWWDTLASVPPGIWGCHRCDDEDFFFCALPHQPARWQYLLQRLF
jgi:carbonic anhydrase/acetyltransferase-like protein (isoleucine patch superfamily)